jgi:hypothetical protein
VHDVELRARLLGGDLREGVGAVQRDQLDLGAGLLLEGIDDGLDEGLLPVAAERGDDDGLAGELLVAGRCAVVTGSTAGEDEGTGGDECSGGENSSGIQALLLRDGSSTE